MMDSKRILVVDDEPKVAFFLQESLESLERNYQVVCAETGESALAEMTRTPFDVVITDLRMPGMNGLELMQHVQSSFPQTRTILITAYGSDEVEAETRRLSAYRYFTKPFHIEDLTAAVQDALGNGTASASALLERLMQRLTDLRYEVGAQCILLADMSGRLLAEVGITDGIAAAQLATVMSQRLVTERETRRLLNEDRAYDLHYHEGVRYDVYSSNIGDRFSLTLVFDRRMGASRIGMVWLYTKRAIQDLVTLVAGEKSAVETGR